MTIRGAVAVLLLAACSAGWAYTDSIVRWKQDALLHDGRMVVVERELQETVNVRIADPFFGLPLSPRTERGGDIHSVKFKHPDTGATVSWQGEEYQSPVLLDVVGGIAYLVVYARPSKKNERTLGCPELPYAFLQSDRSSGGRWSPIPAGMAPADLVVANLSGPVMHPSTGSVESRGPIHLAATDVQDALRREELYARHRFQREIPRTYERWRYPAQEKDDYRNGRILDDCRPPPKWLPNVVLPAPVDVGLEAVETVDVLVKTSDEYSKLVVSKTGKATRDQCKALFTRADPANRMAGERFVNDPTRSKQPPYSASVNGLVSQTWRYCDAKFVWYVAEREESGKIWITKYSSAGDLLYNARIATPQTADNKLARRFVIDSATGEGDHFIFYWDQSLASTPLGPFSHRMTQFRFREPRQDAATR